MGNKNSGLCFYRRDFVGNAVPVAVSPGSVMRGGCSTTVGAARHPWHLMYGGLARMVRPNRLSSECSDVIDAH